MEQHLMKADRLELCAAVPIAAHHKANLERWPCPYSARC